MKKFFKLFLFIINFFFILNFTYADQIYKFADIDLIVKNTLIGKKVLSKINKLDQDNIEKLNVFEKELKNMENEIKLKKNLLSDDELKKEINKLNLKLANYKNQKNIMIKNLSDIKNKELQKLFKTINPVIQNYMNKNSIEILFNSKNIFIGNKNSDLTQDLIEEINNKFNG